MTQRQGSKNFRIPFIAVTSLFFMWGFITVFVDSLIPRLREVFELSYFESGLVQLAFFMAYGLVSIPAGYLLPRIGYKQGMMLGLFTMGAGCLLFWPAAGFRVFGFFLGGLFILAGGMTILQVAANPYVAVLGPAREASSRLNLAQAFNSLGTTIAPVFGSLLILSDQIKSTDAIAQLSEAERELYYASEAGAVQLPFFIAALSIIALATALRFIDLPKVLKTEVSGGYGRVLRDKRLMLGALGIFVYVGTEVAIGSYLVNYFMDMQLADLILNSEGMRGIATMLLTDLEGIDPKGIVGAFVTFYWGGAMLGRFIGAYLTRYISPGKVLSTFGVLALSMLSISILSSGFVSMWSILAVGLFNSIMFPTIFTLAIRDLGDYTPQGSGVLCTAIAGGAFIPPLYGLMTDWFGFKTAMVLLIVCYTYILFYGLFANKSRKQIVSE